MYTGKTDTPSLCTINNFLHLNPRGIRVTTSMTINAQVPAASTLSDDAMKVKVIDGGITNALFRVTLGDFDTLRVRVFGGEGMLCDRVCLLT